MEWRASRYGPHFPVRCGFDLAALRWAIWILRRSIGLWIRCGARRVDRPRRSARSNFSGLVSTTIGTMLHSDSAVTLRDQTL